MKIYKYLLVVVIISLFTPSISNADTANKTTPSPSFDCKKASSKIENIICSDADIASLDKQLADLVSKFHSSLSDNLWKSFLNGQRNWLKLRAEACLLDVKDVTDAKKQKCVKSVYEKRVEGLKQRLENFADNKDVDFDKILDEPRNLSPYMPEDMLSMSSMSYNGEINSDKTILPKTCRELDALSSGLWNYSGGTISGNSLTFAHSTCDFAMMSGQNKKTNSDSQINFRDFKKYSTEFECFNPFPTCDKLPEETVISLAAEDEKGKFRKKRKEQVRVKFILDDDEDFSIDGVIYKIAQMLVGDFTHKGRKEALVKLNIFVLTGTFRNNEVILLYYDETKKIFRPESIDSNNVYKIITHPYR